MRAPGCTDAGTSTRDCRSAGHNPHTSAVTSESTAVNITAAPSTVVSRMNGTLAGASTRTPRTAPSASTNPTAPPSSASTSVSSSKARTRRPRPAPSAARTAISRCRATLRASSRLARLTQQISSTAATATASRGMPSGVPREPDCGGSPHRTSIPDWSPDDRQPAFVPMCRARRSRPPSYIGFQAANRQKQSRAPRDPILLAGRVHGEPEGLQPRRHVVAVSSRRRTFQGKLKPLRQDANHRMDGLIDAKP